MPHHTGHHGTFRQKPRPRAGKPFETKLSRQDKKRKKRKPFRPFAK